MRREGTSLTEAVRHTAGISLTRAVKDAAGRGSFVLEDGHNPAPGRMAHPAPRPGMRLMQGTRAVFATLAALTMVAFAFLHAAPPPPHAPERARLGLGVRRVALVIGNSAYRYSPRLENPRNDAADMSAVLRQLGFFVIEGFDLVKTAFDAKVRAFTEALDGAEVGLLFYAGHGIQVAGRNYLVPIDAKLTTAAALDVEMVRLELVHKTMEREAHTRLLFFDACRDNPLARDLARTMGSRSLDVGEGLAAIESGAGTLISFSTQPGNVALDGKGRNSPYSGALVRELATSREDLTAILMAVRNDVMRQTDHRQVPWEHSALTRRFYFGIADQPPASAAQPAWGQSAGAWPQSPTLGLAAADAFAARYSETVFGDLVRVRGQPLRGQSGTGRGAPALGDPPSAFAPPAHCVACE
jgi:hypothetical protein